MCQQGACPHQPTGRVLASAAPSQLLRLLCDSSDPAVVSACVAAISNLCATEEGQQRIHDEARRSAAVRAAPLLLCLQHAINILHV